MTSYQVLYGNIKEKYYIADVWFTAYSTFYLIPSHVCPCWCLSRLTCSLVVVFTAQTNSCLSFLWAQSLLEGFCLGFRGGERVGWFCLFVGESIFYDHKS